MLSFIFLVTFVYADDPVTVRENNSAVKLIEKDRTLEAQKKLQTSVVNNALRGEFHYNLAQTYEKNENFDDAIKEYQAASKLSKNSELKFQSLFNAARLYGEKKEVAQALQNYQAALEIYPDSVETKTNIELLMKQGGGGGGKKGEQSKSQGGNSQEQSEGQGDKDKENPNQGQKQSQQSKRPQQFESKALTPQDVKRIFEEVQRQDDKIRGKLLDRKPKERKVGKDW